MKGNPKVIAELNAALRDELMAINQYFLHAEMLENWKYTRLSKFIKKQSIDEMKHAEELIERILFLIKDGYNIDAIHAQYPHVERKTLEGVMDEITQSVIATYHGTPLL